MSSKTPLFPRLVELLDQEADAVAAQQVLAGLSEPEVSAEKIIYPKHGICLKTEANKISGVVLYLDFQFEFSPYKGDLPAGIDSTDSPDAVSYKLSREPEKLVLQLQDLYCYSYDKYFLYFAFEQSTKVMKVISAVRRSETAKE